MAASNLKRARLCSFLVHGGYALMIVMLLATNSWMLAFGGILVALTGFAVTGQAAKCPKCASELLSGGAGIHGVINLFRLSAGTSIQCASCDYETRKDDYA